MKVTTLKGIETAAIYDSAHPNTAADALLPVALGSECGLPIFGLRSPKAADGRSERNLFEPDPTYNIGNLP